MAWGCSSILTEACAGHSSQLGFWGSESQLSWPLIEVWSSHPPFGSEVCSILRILRILNSNFHPQSNGMIERFHRSLTSSIRARLACSDWVSHLPPVLPKGWFWFFSCRGSLWYSSVSPRRVPRTHRATSGCFSPTSWMCSFWFLRTSSASCNPSASTLSPPDYWVRVCTWRCF